MPAGQPAGETIAPAQVVFSISDNKYITVTSTGAYVVTAVVVKGGPAYNTYLASALGSLPWVDLHAPINASGKPADISHWFLCGTKGTTTATTTTTTAITTTTAGTTTTTPGSTTTTAGSTTTPGSTTTGTSTPTTATTATTTTAPVVTTTTAPVLAVRGNDNLASTGFGSLWLLFLGGGLLLVGIAFVTVPKLRNLLRR